MANPILDHGGVSDQSVYETSNTQHHKIGTRGTLDDRTFHYALYTDASTALPANALVASAAPIGGHTTQTGAVTSTNQNGVVGTAPAPAGTSFITLAIGAAVISEKFYEEGYWKIESSTLGPGQIQKIKKHPYAAASAAPTGPISFYDPIVTTPTGTVTWSIFANPWSYVVVTPATTITAMTVGVPLVGVAVSATASVATTGYLHTAITTWNAPQYVWVQTWGPSSVYMDTTNLVAGSGAVTSVIAASEIAVESAAGILQKVGVSMEALSTNNVFASIFLTIAP